MSDGRSGAGDNGWGAYKAKILSDLDRIEKNQLRIFRKQEEHSVKLATLFARMSMLSGGIAMAISIATRLVPL